MNLKPVGMAVKMQQLLFPAKQLKRKIKMDLYLPLGFMPGAQYPVLYINDGQDLRQFNFNQIMHQWQATHNIPFVAVALHAHDRVQEYSMASALDYAGRGTKAATYQSVLVEQIIPFIEKNTPFHATHRILAGFSLGGLSAFETAWRFSSLFHKVGVFSGSFWWRAKALDNGYSDADRLAHQLVLQTLHPPTQLSFWFQCGTDDERSDRNKNGIIDSIDDTIDLIQTLQKVGFPSYATHFQLINEGKHDLPTWEKAWPYFLTWAFNSN